MPIPVVCGSCSAKLMAPDAAAGKKVKCKNCQAVIAVPVPVAEEESDFEFVDPATLAPPKPVAAKPVVAAVVPVKAKSKPAVIVEDEDNEEFDFGAAPEKSKAKVVANDDNEDDVPKPKKKSKTVVALDNEDEDDAPRKSKKKAVTVEDEDDEDDTPRKSKKKKKGNPLIFVLGGVGALFALGFIGVMIWYVAVREKEGTAGTKPTATDGTGGPYQQPAVVPAVPPVPAGWTQYNRNSHSMYFKESFGPTTPRQASVNQTLLDKVVAGYGSKSLMLSMSITYRKEALGKMPPAADPYPQMEAATAEYGKIVSRKDIVIDGKPGREVLIQFEVGQTMYWRMVLAFNREYHFGVTEPGITEQSESYRVVFDSVKLKQ